jgi:hypothetical protein
MATGTTNIAALAAQFPAIYERAFIVARAESLLDKLVTRYGDSNGTEDRKFATREQATAQSVAEGTDFQSPDRLGKVAGSTLTPGEVMAQATVNWRAVRQDPTLLQDASNELGMALAQKIDQDIISVFASLNGGAGAQLGTAGSPLTWGIVLAAQAQLKAKNVPGRYNVVLHPYAAHDLSTEVNLVKNLASVPESVKEGLREDMWLGAYQNMDFYVSNNIDADASDDAVNAIFSPEALALDMREGPVALEPETDASARETEFNIYADYAYGVRRSDYGIDIICDVTAPTS